MSVSKQAKTLGYLPQDRPPLGALIALGLQHVVTMFPATVLVALLTGFDVSVTLFASGLATVVALLGSGRRNPLYYGSSFSYIAAVVGVVGAEWGGTRVAQGGIVATALVSIIAGLIIRRTGKEALDKVLPPIVTGSVAIVIGISLPDQSVRRSAGRGLGAPPAHQEPCGPEPDSGWRRRCYQWSARWLCWRQLWREQLAHGHHP